MNTENKTINIKGLLIEIIDSSPQDRPQQKPATNVPTKQENPKPEEKTPKDRPKEDSSILELDFDNLSGTINTFNMKPKIPTKIIMSETEHEQKNMIKTFNMKSKIPAKIIMPEQKAQYELKNAINAFEIKPKIQAKINMHETKASAEQINGAAGLWAVNHNTDNNKNSPPPLIKPVDVDHELTPEDWEIFKMHMDLPKKAPVNIPVYKDLLTMSSQDLIFNTEDFICSLCESFIFTGEGVMLKNCLHTFCEPCLKTTIDKSTNVMGTVGCPFTMQPCDAIMEDEEIKAILGDDYHNFIEAVQESMRTMIRELEAEQNSKIPELLNNDELDFIPSQEKFECQICFSDVEIGEGIMLKNCLHSFCKDCIISQVEASDDFEVKCPCECKLNIQEREIRAIVSPETFDKQLTKSLKLAESSTANSFHCKTPDCHGWIEFEEGVRGFTCQVCLKVNCIGCKAIHQGMNCQEYSDKINPDGKHKRENEASEQAIINLVASGNAMWCPKCNIAVEKRDGCDFITCLTCRLGICWRTKKPRHPLIKANGEVIDGCHCRETIINGRLCHPDCGNCH